LSGGCENAHGDDEEVMATQGRDDGFMVVVVDVASVDAFGLG
jgi:hypothetical protein